MRVLSAKMAIELAFVDAGLNEEASAALFERVQHELGAVALSQYRLAPVQSLGAVTLIYMLDVALALDQEGTYLWLQARHLPNRRPAVVSWLWLARVDSTLRTQ